jgi:hypothetical protein
LPIFVLSLELGKSVWRHVHAAKVLVVHNILEGLQITPDLRADRTVTAWPIPRTDPGDRRRWRRSVIPMRGSRYVPVLEAGDPRNEPRRLKDVAVFLQRSSWTDVAGKTTSRWMSQRMPT